MLKTSIKTEYENLESNLEPEKAAYAKRLKRTKHALLKIADYKKVITDIEANLANNGFSKSIRHGSLKKVYEELENVDHTLRPLKLEVEKFSELPLDLEESRLLLIDAKMKLEETNKKLEDIFSHMSLHENETDMPSTSGT